MMKQILTLLFAFLTLAMARRSVPAPAIPTYREMHRMGWGLDEEFFEPLEIDYQAVKPVKRDVDKKEEKSKKHHRRNNDEMDAQKPKLWGMPHVCDLEEVFGLE